MSAPHVPNTLDTTLNVDVQKQTVEVTQRSDRFALHPQKVVLPFQAIIVVAAQILLAMNNAAPMQIPGAGANESRPS